MRRGQFTSENSDHHLSWIGASGRENATVREMVHAAQLRRTYYGPCIDQLKRGLFLHAVRWHGPLGEAWLPVERKARQTLGAYIDEARTPGEVNAAGRSLLVAVTGAALAIGEPLIHAWFYRGAGAWRRRCCAVIPTPSGAGSGTSSVSSVSFSDVRSTNPRRPPA
jgi:hypothetical protein